MHIPGENTANCSKGVRLCGANWRLGAGRGRGRGRGSRAGGGGPGGASAADRGPPGGSGGGGALPAHRFTGSGGLGRGRRHRLPHGAVARLRRTPGPAFEGRPGGELRPLPQRQHYPVQPGGGSDLRGPSAGVGDGDRPGAGAAGAGASLPNRAGPSALAGGDGDSAAAGCAAGGALAGVGEKAWARRGGRRARAVGTMERRGGPDRNTAGPAGENAKSGSILDGIPALKQIAVGEQGTATA